MKEKKIRKSPIILGIIGLLVLSLLIVPVEAKKPIYLKLGDETIYVADYWQEWTVYFEDGSTQTFYSKTLFIHLSFWTKGVNKKPAYIKVELPIEYKGTLPQKFRKYYMGVPIDYVPILNILFSCRIYFQDVNLNEKWMLGEALSNSIVFGPSDTAGTIKKTALFLMFNASFLDKIKVESSKYTINIKQITYSGGYYADIPSGWSIFDVNEGLKKIGVTYKSPRYYIIIDATPIVNVLGYWFFDLSATYLQAPFAAESLPFEVFVDETKLATLTSTSTWTAPTRTIGVTTSSSNLIVNIEPGTYTISLTETVTVVREGTTTVFLPTTKTVTAEGTAVTIPPGNFTIPDWWRNIFNWIGKLNWGDIKTLFILIFLVLVFISVIAIIVKIARWASARPYYRYY